jgi:hypothetical protein
MANIFKAKTLVGRSGIFSQEVIAPNLVYTTGNQNIGGNKIFNDGLTAKTGFFGLNNNYSGDWTFIGGGSNNVVSGDFTSIGGGRSNRAIADFTIIGGGRLNCAIADFTTIGGGCCNIARGQYSSVLGGRSNCATATYSLVAGGFNNSSSGCYSIVIGGENNKALAHHSYIIGGENITITSNHSGAAVFADAQDRKHFSSGENSLVLDFASGIYFAQPNIYGNLNFNQRPTVNNTGILLIGEIQNVVYTTGDQTVSGIKTFTQTGSFNTLQVTNKKLSSYNYVNSNFEFGDIYINIANSSSSIIGTLPSGITSGINYYVKNLNTGILLITGSGQRSIDGFLNINLYKNESLQLLGVNNIGYTGWVTLSADNGVS